MTTSAAKVELEETGIAVDSLFAVHVQEIDYNHLKHIEKLLPKFTHAVTARGFKIKIALFVLACGITSLGSNLG